MLLLLSDLGDAVDPEVEEAAELGLELLASVVLEVGARESCEVLTDNLLTYVLSLHRLNICHSSVCTHARDVPASGSIHTSSVVGRARMGAYSEELPGLFGQTTAFPAFVASCPS